ncbi:MAG: hypothetical protein ACKV2U_17300 [Bryobacteraceae bacterium]
MTLAEYIRELVLALRRSAPSAYGRLIQVAGERRARIGLDDERVVTGFQGGELVFPPLDTPVDGEGSTDRETVLDLLDGRLEVTEAVLLGRIDACGKSEDVDRFLIAIEVLLDEVAHVPATRALSERFRAEKPRRTGAEPPPALEWYPFRLDAEEFEMLSRLDLLS